MGSDDRAKNIAGYLEINDLQERCKSKKGNQSTWAASKSHPKVAAYCFALSFSALLTGYDVVIVGSVTALPPFQRDYGQEFGDSFILPAFWLSLWNAVTFVGQMLGAISGGWLQDKWGRRSSLMVGSLFAAIGVALCFTSHLLEYIDQRRSIFLAGKAIMGIALGMLMVTTQTFLSEITTPALRGPALGLLPTTTLLGQLIGAIVVYCLSRYTTQWAYLIPIMTQWPLSLLTFFVALITPESPTYLVTKGHLQAALKSLQRLYVTDIDAQLSLEQIKQAVAHEEQLTIHHSYPDCFKPWNQRQTMIILFAGIIPQLFGLTILTQSSYFMQIVGMEANLSLLFLVIGISLGVVANSIGIMLLSKVGRRKLILSSLSISALLWLGIAIADFWTNAIIVWYTAGTLVAVVVVNSLGSWPASFTVAGETSALLLRSKTQGLNWFTNSLFSGILSFTVPYIFNPDAGNLRAKTGFVFAGLCIFGVVVCWLIVPEMKGREHSDIDKMFALGVHTRRFKTWTEKPPLGRGMSRDVLGRNTRDFRAMRYVA